ncbi:MAG: class I SAM-dependent methyltransferase, partial [Candidatus Hodarchaeota archaeon]
MSNNNMKFSDVDIKTVRDYWDRRPCNIRHSDKSINTKEYFDEVERKKYFVEPHIPKFADFSKYKDKKVLEIGCGIGTDSINFARAGAKLTLVELSSRSLEICRKRFKIYNLTAEFHNGNCEELSSFLPIDQYDLVYSFGVIHHTPNPERAIHAIKKYLDIGSELKLMLYSKFSYKLFWIMKNTNNWDFGKMGELIATYSEAQTGCPVTYTYTFEEIKNLLSGFKIEEMYKTHIFPYQI